jgi:hypothetical protein
MRLFEKSFDKRKEKIAEKRNLEQKKQVRDKRYHVVDDEEEEEFEYLVKGKHYEED